MMPIAVVPFLAAILAAPAPAVPDEAAARMLRQFLDQASREGFTGAVLVAREGRILLEEGYGLADPAKRIPVTRGTVFTTGSITKQFTAAAILKLEMAGKLSVGDSIEKHLEGVPEDKRGITLHHLLTHTAGFPGAIGDDLERVGRDEYLSRAFATQLRFRPGTRYEYSNVGYSLLAAIVERVSGEPYETFLRKNLFVPAGMTQTGYLVASWNPEAIARASRDDGSDWGTIVDRAIRPGGPGWHLMGNGGIHSTVGDMYRWHKALLGDVILNAGARTKMYARHAEEPGGTWYGYGWSIEDGPYGSLITHNGGNPYFFSDLLRYVDGDVVIYYSTSSRDRRMRRLAPELARIVFEGTMPDLAAPAAAGGALATSGPPAPPGSPAERWGLPGSFRGLRSGELLDTIAASDEAERLRMTRMLFTPDLLDRRGAENLASTLSSLREEIGEFEVRSARPVGPAKVALALFSTSKGMPIELTIEMEPGEPHRIVSLGIMIGGD